MDVDEPLLLFRVQYLQCIDHDFLAWPPAALLRQDDALSFLFKRLFDAPVPFHKPPDSYERQVLRTLLAKIRQAAGTAVPETEMYANLSDRLSRVENDAKKSMQQSTWEQDAYITYNCASTLDVWQPITLHESRSLISGSQHTGHRTWQGALHLATYLLARPSLVSGKRVLELGAGTGFLSILCKRFLDATYVTATDGEQLVVEEMRKNLRLNGFEDNIGIAARKLWWGSDLEGDWRPEGEGEGFDVVVGADIIYQKEATRALVQALRALLDLQPRTKILLSNALRFPDVFEVFNRDCATNKLFIHVVDYKMTPPLKQKSLFYSTAIPLQVVEVRDSQ